MLPEAEKFNKDLNQWQEDFLVSARNAFKIVFFGMAKPLFEKYPEIKTVSFLTEMDAWDGPDCGQEPCIDSGQFLVNEFDWVNVCIEEAREALPFLCAENDMLPLDTRLNAFQYAVARVLGPISPAAFRKTCCNCPKRVIQCSS